MGWIYAATGPGSILLPTSLPYWPKKCFRNGAPGRLVGSSQSIYNVGRQHRIEPQAYLFVAGPDNRPLDQINAVQMDHYAATGLEGVCYGFDTATILR